MKNLAEPNSSSTRALNARPNVGKNVPDPAFSSAVDSARCTSLITADLSRDDLTGLTLGPYVLGRRIGCGGMGQVFEARHATLGKKFAVKLMLSGVAQNADAERRFRDEVVSVGRLKHPNILNASDAGCYQGVHFLVTEFIDGLNLGQLVAANRPLPVHKACDIICQAARGLSHAHSMGFIHRDIKPSNLMIDNYGVVRILDFGLVRNDEQSDGITAVGQLLGTIDFLAPEQAADGRIADQRSDLYSLGGTLLFLLTGKPPFSGEQFASLTAKIHGHLFLQPPGLQEVASTLPETIRSVLERLLAKQPCDRPASADEVVRQLEAGLVAFPSNPAIASSNIGPVRQQSVPIDTAPAENLARRRIKIGGPFVSLAFATVAIFLVWVFGAPAVTPSKTSGELSAPVATITASSSPPTLAMVEPPFGNTPNAPAATSPPATSPPANAPAANSPMIPGNDSDSSSDNPLQDDDRLVEVEDDASPAIDSTTPRTVELKRSLSSWNVGPGPKLSSNLSGKSGSATKGPQPRAERKSHTKDQP